MNLVVENKFKRKLKKKLFKWFLKLDNSVYASFEENGEEKFVKDLVKEYKNRQLVVFDIGANRGDYTSILLAKQKRMEWKLAYLLLNQRNHVLMN